MKRWTKRLVRAVTSAVVGAGLALTASNALAASTEGACDVYVGHDQYTAFFWLDYHTSGSFDYPDTYRWRLLGTGLGNKNNVVARVKTVNTGGTDSVKHTYISGDNVPAGSSSRQISNVRVSRGSSMYGAYEFVFDRANDSDPRCTGRTKSV
ncbi:hypothetical protein [Jiangella asiatica]|uniref:Secreted protein n=1 Tax=Jiangella asiatica TaxID=2530372 RepID=A0A4R5DB79_9ACTN|nr:hypothetical protein [Jiangella asiatica]TDE10936.1 hypothetical protein E1269_10665 [Jiangella asiatica]